MALLHDPMASVLLGGRPKRWPIAVATVGTAGLIGSVLAIGLALARGYADSADAAAPPIVTAAAPSPAPAPSATLNLPQPTGYVGIVPMGYPRTAAGAIAAAYGYSRIASGLDVDRTLAAIELLADPATGWFAAQRDVLADGLVAQRRELGLSPVGPTAAAALQLSPAEYQLLGTPTADAAHVLTLNIVSGTAVDGTHTTGTIVLDWDLRWDAGRWVVSRTYCDNAHDNLAVTPLTTDARALGWQVAHGG